MKGETFNSYQHYRDWLNKNWEKSHAKDAIIVNSGLMIERRYNLNGEPYGCLTEYQFIHRQEYTFIPF